jgi:hypothetical protein
VIALPFTLEGWNIDAVRKIVAQGVFESDDFDLKENLPNSKDRDAKQKLNCTCAAFANSSGGFLIYGVKNDKSLNISDRICGINSNYDFPEHFGNFPAKCSPSIHWTFKNPPLTVGHNRSVHIVHIPRSWKAPHAVDTDGGKWLFPKRTNKGTEWMDIDEVRTMFLSFYEKRIRLQLLKSELSELKQVANIATNIEPHKIETSYNVVTFDLTVIQSILADTFALTSSIPGLLEALANLRFHVRIANNSMDIFFRKVVQPLSGMNEIVRSHNEFMIEKSKLIQEWCDKATIALDEILEPNVA